MLSRWFGAHLRLLDYSTWIHLLHENIAAQRYTASPTIPNELRPVCASGYYQVILTQRVVTLIDESRPMGGFIPAETLAQNVTAGDNGTAGRTLNQPVLGFLAG